MTYNDTISWIDVNESLPKVEERVLVLICRHSNYTNKDYKIVTCAIYEDGTTDIENSCWDCDSDSANYDKETDTCYIPKGWYEFHEYGDTENDGIGFISQSDGNITDTVTHWMSLSKFVKEV